MQLAKTSGRGMGLVIRGLCLWALICLVTPGGLALGMFLGGVLGVGGDNLCFPTVEFSQGWMAS